MHGIEWLQFFKFINYIYKFFDKILPSSWLNYIDQSSKSEVTTVTEEKLWRELFKSYFIRIMLFSIILYTIIIFANQSIRPLAAKWLPNVPMRILVTTIVLIIMAPFLKALIGWNMIVPEIIRDILVKMHLKKPETVEKICDEHTISEKCMPTSKTMLNDILNENKERVKNLFISNSRIARISAVLWYSRKSNRIPLLILTSLRLLVVAFFIVTAVHLFLTENPKVILILLIGSIFLIMQSKWLLNQYLKMENQFLDNLNGENEKTHD